MKIRTHEENVSACLEAADIVKYHSSLPNFDKDEIRKIKAYIRFHAYNVQKSEHYEQRCLQKNIPNISLCNIMKYSKCFEYKMDRNNKLFRLAIRIKGFRGEDYIFIIQPEIKVVDNYHTLFVKFITAYGNRSEDKHFTLNKDVYSVI